MGSAAQFAVGAASVGATAWREGDRWIADTAASDASPGGARETARQAGGAHFECVWAVSVDASTRRTDSPGAIVPPRITRANIPSRGMTQSPAS